MDEHEYYEVKISAEDRAQAETILNSLLKKGLVAGGSFLNTPARFMWKGEISDMPDYVTVTSYTTSEQITDLIEDVRSTSNEEVPMVTFAAPAAMNSELQDWIDETLAGNDPVEVSVSHEDDDADIADTEGEGDEEFGDAS